MADSSSVPVTNADVIVTVAPRFDVIRGTTASNGLFRVVVDSGAGDYLVSVVAVGYKTWRQRVTIGEGVGDSAYLEVRLNSAVRALAPVSVAATRTRPSRAPELGPRNGGAETVLGSVAGGVDSFDGTDLQLLASLSPGLHLSEAGLTALGIHGSQTRMTLDGLQTSWSTIPRDMRVRVRASTTAYDPAIGGFSGALVAAELRPGGVISRRSARGSYDGTVGTLWDADMRAAGRTATRAALSLAGDGELRRDAWYYNAGVQLRRIDRPLASLGLPTTSLLRTQGVTDTELRELFAAQDAIGFPRPGRTSVIDGIVDAELLVRLDRTPSVNSRNTFAVTAGLGGAAHKNASLSAFSASSGALTGASRHGSLRLAGSRYLRETALMDWRIGIGWQGDEQSPDVLGPRLTVPLRDPVTDTPLAYVALGGGAGGVERASRSLEGQLEFRATPGSARWASHQIKAFAHWRMDVRSLTTTADLGQFQVFSVNDLPARQASTYSRTILGAERKGTSLNLAFGFGDQWRPSRFLFLTYGVRSDVGGLLGVRSADAVTRQVLGLTPSPRSPLQFAVSPRLGFRWVYAREKLVSTSVGSGVLGNLTRPASGELRGGLGFFQDVWDAETGLRIDTWRSRAYELRLTCGRADSPGIQWITTFAEAPTVCTAGASTEEHPRRTSTYLNSEATAPGAWRANLAWTRRLGRWDVGVDGILSLGVNQPVFRDRNLTSVPQFTLTADGGRPSYRSQNAIDSTTGQGRSALARPLGASDAVWEISSEGRVWARQLTATVSPDLGGRQYLRATLTYAVGRERVTGFSGAGRRSPLEMSWSASALLPRWASTIELGTVRGQHAFTLLLQGRTGLRYSPLIDGDANGDGLSRNDLPFVPALRAVPQSVVDSSLGVILARGGSAAECVRSNAGGIARRSSCAGPMTGSVDMMYQWSPSPSAMEKRGGGRLAFSARISNFLGLIDNMTHRHAAGWGPSGTVDPVLMSIVGFDQSTASYQYSLNPRFGRRDAQRDLLRYPYRLSLDASLFLGRSVPEQQLARATSRRQVASPQRLSAQSLRERYRRSIRDPFAELLQEGDSLLLQRHQIERIEPIGLRYRQRVDSVWTDLASYLQALPLRFEQAPALERQEAATVAVWRIGWEEVQALRSILSAAQLRVLTSEAKWLLSQATPPTRGIRSIER